MPYFYLLLLLHSLTTLFAQPKTLNAEENLRNLVLAAYEREELSKNTLTQVREKIHQNITSEAMLLQFDEYFSGVIKKDRNKYKLSAGLKKQIESFISLDSLELLIMNWQQKKLQLLQLIQHNLTAENLTNPSFSDTSKVFQYLSFFNIQHKDAVAELGAGSGWLSLLIRILYQDINLYVNELGTYLLDNTKANLRGTLTKDQWAQTHFVVGSNTSTGLETQDLNIIIAVDVFHHFKDKPSMLQAIKWSLAKEGRLCLVEQVKTIGKGNYFCPQALEKWQVEDLMRLNGFVKTREQLLKGTKDQNISLLEYQVHPL